MASHPHRPKAEMQTCVAEYLLNAASTWPLAPAVVDAHGELGHGALLHHALAVARQIQSRDGHRQRPLAVLIGKSCAAVTAIAGATIAGHPYVPLDTASPVARLQAVIRQLGEPLVICTPQTQKLLDQLDVPAEHCLLLDPATLLNVPSTAEIADSLEQARRSVSAIIDTDPVYVIFTSGSTGVPKGVTIAHRSVVDYIEWARETYPVDATDRMASQAPLHFDNATLDLYLCLATGATLYLPPDPTYAFPALTLDYLERHAITTVFWVPSVLVAIANSGLLQKRPPRQLRHILFAGEQMPVPHINAWVDAVPGALFSNLYGPTEITVDCTAFTFRTRFEGDILPIGHARRNTEILVLAEDDTACAPDQIGELCVRGTALALGYWNDAARTAEVFVQNPLQTRFRDLIYRTGDLVRRDREGCITFLGRKDSQIKHNGHRIELGEIEAAAYALDGVAVACAVYDAAQRRLTLAVAFKPGHASDVVPLRLGLARRLPKYMMPNSIELMPHFPLNANGKIDRIKLSTLIASKA